MAVKLTIRRCKQCGSRFQQTQPLQYLCMPPKDCSWKYQQVIKSKKEAKEWKDKKAEMKAGLLTMKDYIKLYQITFNTFIRARDKNLPCVSCGAEKCEEFHAGHYIDSTYQYLRFNENNVWKQCSKCNTHLRGNSIPYRIELIKRIGLEDVELLENSRHMALEITVSEIKEKIIYYKSKIKELK